MAPGDVASAPDENAPGPGEDSPFDDDSLASGGDDTLGPMKIMFQLSLILQSMVTMLLSVEMVLQLSLVLEHLVMTLLPLMMMMFQCSQAMDLQRHRNMPMLR